MLCAYGSVVKMLNMLKLLYDFTKYIYITYKYGLVVGAYVVFSASG